MLKQLCSATFVLMAFDAFAVKDLELHHAPLSTVNSFIIKQQSKNSVQGLGRLEKNTLMQISQTQKKSSLITRYQQMYQGIPVVGAQITVENATVNGHLLTEVQLNTLAKVSSEDAVAAAKKSWLSFNSPRRIDAESSELQIRVEQGNELRLVYLVSFKTTEHDNKPVWPFFVVDAQNGSIISQWNNIKNYKDSGPGGNEKTHEYWYGKEGLPFLEVMQKDHLCIMETDKVKLVNLNSAWDWNDLLVNSFQYTCNNNLEEQINGAFSPTNDAYYFGHTIVDMYKEWYGVNALQDVKGNPMQLVMRVHFGQQYDNAFWDGQFMSFGDGNDFYPLVSLDVAGHEVTHGFTEQHSGLEYHDEPGALNESLSDMAGQTARAYLLEKMPQLYAKLYLEPEAVTWGIGETIVKDSFGKALRFMDYPSSDGSSADCLDKRLAQSYGAYCAISYPELVTFAKSTFHNPQERQNYIVHTASGIFNKAFYLLSKHIGIKKAYQMMVIANSKYWTPTTDFKQGACGVLYAAKDIQGDQALIQSVFGQVGVDVTNCDVG